MMDVNMFQNMMKILQDCVIMCEQTINFSLHSPDVHARVQQIQLLRDCCDICILCTQLVSRNSKSMRNACKFCAYTCKACAYECSRFSDQQSQMCAQMCLDCARECRVMASVS
ncbi:putative cysteine-rich protein YhjQ [Priestia megaterium]